MKSPEFVLHGNSSQETVKKIEEQGFKTLESRATVSASLLYAYEWATQPNKRKGSKDKREVEEGEMGKIIIMKVPKDKEIDYDSQSAIRKYKENIGNKENKWIVGRVDKYISGRYQMAVYEKGKTVDLKNRQELLIPQENILMTLIPDQSLGELLHTLEDSIKSLKSMDINTYVERLEQQITQNRENYISSEVDLKATLKEIVKTTIEALAVKDMRSLAMRVRKETGYVIYDNNKKAEKFNDGKLGAEKLRSILKSIKSKIAAREFSSGIYSVDRYLRLTATALLKDLESLNEKNPKG